MKSRVINRSIIVLFLSLVLLTMAVSGALTMAICTNPADQKLPAISGNNVVWVDYRNGNADIYLWDLEKEDGHLLSTSTDMQNYPDISGDTVVWMGTRNGAGIYKWDPVNGIERVTNQGDRPQISGDTIVWEDPRNGNYDIYMWDPVNGEQPVCTNQSDQWVPAISGDTIVWVDTRNGNADIYMWDPVNGEQPVCTNQSGPLSNTWVRISGDTVVWSDERNGNADIYKWDPVNGEQVVCDNPAYQNYPDISGDTIVWLDLRNGNGDIYKWDPVNGEQRVTDSSYEQWFPAISGDTIVWQDSRSGNWDIYALNMWSQPPIANAGSDQTVTVGTLVTLDGTGSSDPDSNLPLTYAWIMSAPSGSTATLSSTTTAKPTFTPDKPGDYVITLTVKDSLGLPSTVTDSVTITVTNDPLVAAFKSYNLVEANIVEGPHMAGGKIIFVQEASDPDGQIVKYDWDFGNGTIITSTEPDEFFTIVYTEPESYTISLTVTDNKDATATATEELDLTLEPGDLILLRSGPPYSTIFDLIGFTYTHVGMYVGKIDGTHYMIESAIKPIGKSLIKKDGVQLTTFNRWSVDNKEKYADAVKVNVDPETKKRAVAWAMSKLGNKYDFESIPLNLKQLDSEVCKAYENKDNQKTCKKLKDAYYCSELVWAAYYSVSNGNIDLSIPYFTYGAIPPDALIPDGKYPNPYMKSISWHHEHKP